jgi:hypothetical protein
LVPSFSPLCGVPHKVGTGGRTNERIVLTTRKKDDILEQKVKPHSFFSKIKPAPLVF